MKDERFIELIRVLDATFGEHDRAGLATGQTGKRLLQALGDLPGVDLSDELRERVTRCVQDQGANVRATLKDVYMFPQRVGEYAPWVEMPWPVPNLPECLFQIKMVDGKVYAQQVDGPDFIASVYAALEDEAGQLGLKPNMERSHVTLVNSDEVARIGADHVAAAVAASNSPFPLQVKGVMTTVSRDWPVFSTCAVVKVNSEQLACFMAGFPQVRLKSYHVTFAQKPRALSL